MRRLVAARVAAGVSAIALQQRDLTGVVKNWKHVNGFGFITGDENQKEFFTNRTSLGGGFFLNPGQAVSFEEERSDPTKNPKAINVKNADGTPIMPIEINGVVMSKSGDGGVIQELDVKGNAHPDSPTFRFRDEQVESLRNLYPGRFVRFAIDATTGEPYRIVERKLLRPDVSASPGGDRRVARNEQQQDATANSKMLLGTVREVRASHGFISSHASNESIFFHNSDVEGEPVSVGDQVAFAKTFDTSQQNAGKPRARQVRKVVV